jgi:hypothetical protein
MQLIWERTQFMNYQPRTIWWCWPRMSFNNLGLRNPTRSRRSKARPLNHNAHSLALFAVFLRGFHGRDEILEQGHRLGAVS